MNEVGHMWAMTEELDHTHPFDLERKFQALGCFGTKIDGDSGLHIELVDQKGTPISDDAILKIRQLILENGYSIME